MEGAIYKTREAYIREFFTDTGATYNRVVSCFTLGIDRLWKKRIVEKLKAPQKILDLACGTGILTLALAKRFPASEITAVDISPSYLEVSWRNIFKNKVKNVSFILSAAEEYTEEGFDAVTASYLPKYADLDKLIQNLSRMLKPNGVLIFHDFTYPQAKILRILFEGYFKVIPIVGGWMYPEWKPVLRQLPDLIRETKWVSQMTEALARYGFDQVQVESLTLEGSALVSARKPAG